MEKPKSILTFLHKYRWPLITMIVAFLMGFIGYIIIVFGGGLIVKDEDFVLNQTTMFETVDGEIVGELYEQKRQLISIEEIPNHVIEAFVAIEDHRFFDHAGIDARSVLRAIYRDVLSFSKVEGASTITQQLAKNLFLTHEKTWMRKTKEVMAAIYLERHYSKYELLELYLNTIYFGHGLYGIETAAQFYFSKGAEALTISEGALLAGLIKAPTNYSPIDHPDKALSRRNLVLEAMADQGFLKKETQLREQRKTLGLQVAESKDYTAYDSFIDLVIREAEDKYQLSPESLRRDGYRIIVTMDPEIQKLAYEAFREDDYFPGNVEGVEGAFVLMDEETGAIRSAIGGRSYKRGDLNRVHVQRQPGSTMKPIAVYGPAMMSEQYHPYSLIKDEQVDYDGYVATNVNGLYAGSVSMFDALVYSKNAPAVWLLDQIGIDYAKTYLELMNIDLSDQGLAIALGGLEKGISPLQMAEAYRTFAHHGEWTESYTIEKIYNSDGALIAEARPTFVDVFSPQVAWNMTEMLVDTVQIGTAKSGHYEKALAGKTGSTEHPYVQGMTKDAWFVGYTPEYVVSVWMGYDRSDENHYLTGGSAYPTMLTKDLLTAIDQKYQLTAAFSKPEEVENVPEPIQLPEQIELNGNYTFGLWPLVQGKLTWTDLEDDRIVYRIYREGEDHDEFIGETQGQSEFVIEDISIFNKKAYYVVPYNPLTGVEGTPSNVVWF